MSPSSLPDRGHGAHPLALRGELRPAAKADPQELADLRRVVGALVERALQLLGVTKQDAAWRMAYRDAGAVSRWCRGTERPLFDKLFTIAGFRRAYLRALAETEPDAIVTTQITLTEVA